MWTSRLNAPPNDTSQGTFGISKTSLYEWAPKPPLAGWTKLDIQFFNDKMFESVRHVFSGEADEILTSSLKKMCKN